MLKRIILLVAVLVAAVGGYFAGRSKVATAQAATTITVPNYYGAFKCVYREGYLVFEDSAGTIRVVGMSTEAPVTFVIERK
jgi:hypothetical protein